MSDKHTTVQYQLRLPEELRNTIRESAKNHNRSMNADIVARLEASFAEESAYPPGYVPGYDNGIRLEFDSEWFKQTGLTAEEFAHYVRLSMLSGLKDKKDD